MCERPPQQSILSSFKLKNCESIIAFFEARPVTIPSVNESVSNFGVWRSHVRTELVDIATPNKFKHLIVAPSFFKIADICSNCRLFNGVLQKPPLTLISLIVRYECMIDSNTASSSIVKRCGDKKKTVWHGVQSYSTLSKILGFTHPYCFIACFFYVHYTSMFFQVANNFVQKFARASNIRKIMKVGENLFNNEKRHF